MRLILSLFLVSLMPPLQAADPVSSTAIHDPMRPPAFALRKYREQQRKSSAITPARTAAKAKPLRLHSILYSPARRRAIINGRLLAVGDRIAGAKLIAIERERVRLLRDGAKIVLKLGASRLEMKKTRTR